MAAIVFPISSAPGPTPQEGSGRLINSRAIKTEQGARSPFRWPRSAGLRELINGITSHSHCRGAILIGSILIVVMSTRVYSITESAGVFTATDLGALAGTDTVTIAQNNAATPQIVAVCDAGTFNLFVDSAPTSFADGDMPALNSIASLNGYLIGTTGGGQIWATGLNVVTVDSDAFTGSQAKPDGLLRGVAFRGEFFAMGQDSVQVYDEVGSSPFPLQDKKIVIPRGLIGTHAVAGWEDGWANELLWIGSDCVPYQLSGYTPVPIGNDDVCRAIAAAADRSLIEACVYMEGKNAIWSITSPGEWTWEYNLSVPGGSWTERQSYQRTDWRGRRTIKAFNRWIAGDDTTGKLAAIDTTYMREFGQPLVWQVDSGINADFPYRFALGAAYFWFSAALGMAAGEDPVQTDPRVKIAWSLDGGYTYGNPVLRDLGAQGEGGKLVGISTLGLTKAKGVRIRLEISDPVEPGFMGGDLPNVKKRAA